MPPTNDASDDNNEEFYRQLQVMFAKAKKMNIIKFNHHHHGRHECESARMFKLTLANPFNALRYGSGNKEKDEEDFEAEYEKKIKRVYTVTCAEVLSGQVTKDKRE